jgi:hypothetical protein
MANLWDDSTFGDVWEVRWLAPTVEDGEVTVPPYITARVNAGTEHTVVELASTPLATAQQPAGADIAVSKDGLVVVAYTLYGATPIYRRYCRNGKATTPAWTES